MKDQYVSRVLIFLILGVLCVIGKMAMLGFIR